MTSKNDSNNLKQFNKFLSNNVAFLKEKFEQHFGKQTFSLEQLQTKSKIQTSIKYIYDVFSFGKYQNNDQKNQALKKSLHDNVISFVKQTRVQKQEYNKLVVQKTVCDGQMGIRLLRFCIENNQMFAVHYDRKQKEKVKEKEKEKQKQLQKEDIIVGINKQQSQQQKDKQQEVKPQQVNQKKQEKEVLLEQKKIVKQQKINIQKKPKSRHQIVKNKEQVPYFVPQLQNSKKQLQEQNQQAQTILKKQAKSIFDFYCKQQSNIGGPNTTFDQILHESETMTLGKFMAFASTTGILQPSKKQNLKVSDTLTKKKLIEMFKKVAKFNKQIHFDVFFKVLKEISKIDSTVFDKLCLGRDLSVNQITRNLKYLSAPFSMKERATKSQQKSDKLYIPKSTEHSGRFQSSLKQSLQQRKQNLRYFQFYQQQQQNQNSNYPHPFSLNESKLNLQQMVQRNTTKLQTSKIRENKAIDYSFLDTDISKHHKTTAIKQKNKVVRLQNSRINLDEKNLLGQKQLDVLESLILNNQHQNDDDDEFLKEYKIPKLYSNSGLRNQRSKVVPSVMDNEQEYDTGTEAFKMNIHAGRKRKNIVNQLKQRIKEVQLTERKHQTSLQAKRRGSYSLYSKY